MRVIRIGVIGYGHWGPNLVRNFSELSGATVAAVCDHHADRLALARQRHPESSVTQDFDALLRDASLDAIAIATPISTHYDLAMAALESGKHVLVEKPLAETVEQARALTAAAERLGRVLLVDHTLVYSGAIRKLAELVHAGELGRIVHFDATRINLGLFRDVNVIADLGVHDFAILDQLVTERPVAVSATGSGHIDGVPESIANVSLFYASGTSAHVGLSWFAPIRQRQILLAGDRKMAVYNELDQEHPIRIHDKGVLLREDESLAPLQRLTYQSADVLLPKIDQTGPLRVLCQHFVDCIANGVTPITDGRMGTRMVKMIDAATRSMHARGQPIELDHTGTR